MSVLPPSLTAAAPVCRYLKQVLRISFTKESLTRRFNRLLGYNLPHEMDTLKYGPHYTTLYYTILYYTILYYPILYYITLSSIRHSKIGRAHV